MSHNHKNRVNAQTATQKGLKSRLALCAALALTLTACETLGQKKDKTQTNTVNDRLEYQTIGRNIVRPEPEQDAVNIGGNGSQVIRPTGQSTQSYIPTLSAGGEAGADTAGRAPRLKTQSVDAFVKPLPVPEFIDVVFGGMLETPYVTGPGVAEMTEIVQLRSSGRIASRDFLELVSVALEDYGVRVLPENGTYRLIKDEVLRARIPKFVKSRAQNRTPNNLRPIIQFVELQAVEASSMKSILEQAFPRNKSAVKIAANQRENYITLSGLPEDVNAALLIIRELDELDYAGTQVLKFSPKFWEAESLSQELENALLIEGWQVTRQPLLTRNIGILAISYSNDIFIFTRSAEARQRAAWWVEELDKPVDGGDTEQIYVYQVKNTDASILASTANSAMSGNNGSSLSSGGGVAGNASITSSGSNQLSVGRLTVDPLGNRIIFTGTANEYEKIIRLLEALDSAAPEVLIEVQIAEVSLEDSTSSGVEILNFDDLGNNSVRGVASNSGLGLGSAGLNVGILTGNIEAQLNAFASNRRVKVLSTPVLVARSGGAASIQVGTDVPIITSQGASPTQSQNGVTDILQNVEYRSTGVLLNIEPIVFSGNRIDLTVTQEVSATIDVANSSISSPTISNRSISTQLSLEDGSTAVMGGLIQENLIRSDTGIPFLKDVPVLGQAFSVDSYSVDRTELVVLITAYVIRGQEDKTRFVQYLSSRVEGLLSDDTRLITLNPIVK